MSTYDTMLISIWKAVCGGVSVCVCACVWVCGLLNRLAQEIAEKTSWKVTESGLKVELVFGSAHECLTLVRSIPSTHHSHHTNCHSSIMNRSFVWPPFLTRSLSLSHSIADALKVAVLQPVHNAGHVQQYAPQMPHGMQLQLRWVGSLSGHLHKR